LYAVCLSVCLFVCRLAWLKNHTSKFHQIFCTRYRWLWLGLRLTAMRYVMFFRFCGRHCFYFHIIQLISRIRDDADVSSSSQVAARRRSLSSTTASCYNCKFPVILLPTTENHGYQISLLITIYFQCILELLRVGRMTNRQSTEGPPNTGANLQTYPLGLIQKGRCTLCTVS